jgi:hypothetical protein
MLSKIFLNISIDNIIAWIIQKIYNTQKGA